MDISVEDATKVTVTLTDGRSYLAEVKGVDEIVDIAVLKILPSESDGKKPAVAPELPVAELGDSDNLNVGQLVVAVGSPGGLDNTVTMGIVSGLERSSAVVGIPHKKVDYIQTDAAINPGNSGEFSLYGATATMKDQSIYTGLFGVVLTKAPFDSFTPQAALSWTSLPARSLGLTPPSEPIWKVQALRSRSIVFGT